MRQLGQDVVELLWPDRLRQHGEDDARMALGGRFVGSLTRGDTADELVDVEALRALGRAEPGRQLGRQKRGEVACLPGRDALGERRERRLDGALGGVAFDAG